MENSLKNKPSIKIEFSKEKTEQVKTWLMGAGKEIIKKELAQSKSFSERIEKSACISNDKLKEVFSI